jgi:hypothetical protein
MLGIADKVMVAIIAILAAGLGFVIASIIFG